MPRHYAKVGMFDLISPILGPYGGDVNQTFFWKVNYPIYAQGPHRG